MAGIHSQEQGHERKVWDLCASPINGNIADFRLA